MNATVEKAPPTPAAQRAGAAGGPTRAPERRPGLPTEPGAPASRGVWAPVLGKAAGILAGMLALAGIGAASTVTGTGVPVPVAAAAPSTRAHGVPSASSTATPPSPKAAPAGSTEHPAPGSTPAPSASAPSGIPGLTADGKVILNVATASDLTRLPKVGVKRAEAIIQLRTRLGRFRKPTDLLRVKGIGRKTLDGMLPLLVVDPPHEAPSGAAAPEGG